MGPGVINKETQDAAERKRDEKEKKDKLSISTNFNIQTNTHIIYSYRIHVVQSNKRWDEKIHKAKTCNGSYKMVVALQEPSNKPSTKTKTA